MANLFTTETPSLPDVNEGGPITLAQTFYVTAAGNCTGGRFYGPVTTGGTYELVLWQITADDNPVETGTGTVLASATFGTITASAWNSISFSSAVALSTGVAYRIGIRTSLGRYAATGGFYASAGLTNGSIVAQQTGTNPAAVGIGNLDNGNFIENITTYPNKTFNGNCYFVDPEFTATGTASATTGPYVVTASRAPAFARPLIVRSTLADPPVLTTKSPLVVAARPAVSASAAVLLRGSTIVQAPATATPGPLVVTRPIPPGPALPTLLRSTLADPLVLTTAKPLLVTAPIAPTPGPIILSRTPAAPAVVPPASTSSPLLVTAPVPQVPSSVAIKRGSLADDPVLTTPGPIVVTAAAPLPASAAILARNPQPDAPILSGPTTAPIVVTAPAGPPGATTRTLRAHLQDAIVATPQPLVVTAATPAVPSQPILARGSLADLFAGTAPLVVTAAPTITRALPILARTAAVATAPVTSATPAPIVVSATRQTSRGLVALIRTPAIAGAPPVNNPSAPGPVIRTAARRLVVTTTSWDRTLRTETRGG